MDKRDSDGAREEFPCDVILIAGFLGAGKTTLLKNILTWPGDLSGTAVLVNEFGKVGIDGELLEGFDTPVVELTNGCICCTLQGDLVKVVEKILQGFHPRQLLIEATGVADPFEILKFLGASRLKEWITMPKVVTVLNADLWEGRDYFGPLFYNQIKAADLLLFNKIDLLPKKDVPQCLKEVREINPSSSVAPTHYCRIDPEMLWGLVTMEDRDVESLFSLAHPEAHESAEKMGYVNFAFESKVPFKSDCFRHFIKNLPLNLYRVKGFALLDDKYFFVNHAGNKTEWVELEKKLSNKCNKVTGKGSTKLAFVGWQVNKKQVIEDLKACLESDSRNL